ncbi:MAG: hypothetical protein WCG87_11075 [Bacteroidota bacterium]
MKKILIYSVFFATVGILWSSCSKKDTKPSSTMTATINGTAFTANTISTTIGVGYKIVKGVKTSTNESITLVMSDTSTVVSLGVYSSNGNTLDTSGSNFEYVSTTNYNAKSDVGTFEITTKDSVVITNGNYTIYW